jgi:hypothetical protein
MVYNPEMGEIEHEMFTQEAGRQKYNPEAGEGDRNVRTLRERADRPRDG